MGADIGEDFGTAHPSMGLFPDRVMNLCCVGDQGRASATARALCRVSVHPIRTVLIGERSAAAGGEVEPSASVEHDALDQWTPAAVAVTARTGRDEEVVPAGFAGDGLFEKAGNASRRRSSCGAEARQAPETLLAASPS
jgi:hypothetical protein